jgi:SulP family sulfate permease
MILAALVFIRKVPSTTTASQVLQHKEIPAYVTIFRIHGPFLFGATDKVEQIFAQIEELPPIVILRLRNMTAIDATGLQALENTWEAAHSSGRGLILCGAREQPARLMKQAEFEQHVGSENICRSVEEALERAKQLHAEMAAQGSKPVVLEA